MYIFFIMYRLAPISSFFFFNDPAPPEIYPLPLHDALPICRPARVVGDLEATPFVARDPVHEVGTVVRPHGQRFFGKALVTRRRAEEVHLLARGAYAVADDVGKEPAEPGAAGEDVVIGAQRAAVREAHAAELAAFHGPGRLGRELAIFPACSEHGVDDRGAGDASGQVAPVPLEDGPAHPLATDLRVAARRLSAGQLLEDDARFLEERECRALVRIVVLHEPENADRVVQLAAPAALVRLPQREGARRQVCEDPAGPVRGTNHTRLTARAGARVHGRSD